ncbi:hypothetical protein MMC18_009700 [Xylographa bjoerkii]|nr:hypothetical protein [Xylographa bjoerkii]
MSRRCVARLSTIIDHGYTRPRPIFDTASRLSNTPTARHIYSRRSPKVKDAEWARKHRPAAQPKPLEGSWPFEVLHAAYQSGGLPVTPPLAVDVLEAFAALTIYNQPSKKAVQKLCQEHGIQPMTLTMLSRILLKAGDREHFPLVRDLLLSSSALNDEAATITLVNQAVETGKMGHPDIVAPRAHLVRLAAAGNPAAMVLQAELLAAQRQPQKALLMCEEAVKKNTNKYTGAEAIGETKRKAWSTLAKLRKQQGDVEGAKLALEKGALEHDDPWAYYYLANTYRRPSDPEYLHFMLKAAASGIPDAANKLGRFYLGLPQSSRAVPKDYDRRTSRGTAPVAMQFTDREKQLLAIEWFSVSIEYPNNKNLDESQVFLALLLRGQGDHKKGRSLLQSAMSSKIYGPNAVPWFFARWHGEQDFLTAKFLTRDMEKVIHGEMDDL